MAEHNSSLFHSDSHLAHYRIVSHDPSSTPHQDRPVSPMSDGFTTREYVNIPIEPTEYGTKNGMPHTHIASSQSQDKSGPVLVETKTRQPFNPWIWEILACLFSLVCIAAVIVVLAFENGKPLDQWAWTIGPTAVISFIATLAKASLLYPVAEALGQMKWQQYDGQVNPLGDFRTFDNASRGPFGAAQLIAKKHVKAILASLASVLIIVALFIDPFMQLVFSFPVVSMEEPGETASFNRAETYDPNGYYIDSHYTATTATAASANMQAAIIGSVYTPSNSMAASCTTGNCTWPDITTLGVCGSCNNITEKVNVTCPRTGRRAQCTYLLPSGKNLTGSMFEAGATGDYFPTRWNSTASGLRETSKYGSAAGLTYIEAVQLLADFDYENWDIYSVISKPTAWECTLSLCLKTFPSIQEENGEVTSGTPIEAPIYVTNNTILFNSSGGGYTPLVGLSSNATPSTNGSFFWMNDLDWENTGAYLTEVFSWGWGLRGFGVSNQIADATAPNLGQWLADAADLSQTIDTIAGAMTEVIRTNPNSTVEAGTAFESRVYIRVQWAWLALPISLAVLSLLLVIVMVFRTARGGAPAWKSSAVAPVLYNIDGWHASARGSPSALMLEKRARDIWITLPRNQATMSFAVLDKPLSKRDQNMENDDLEMER